MVAFNKVIALASGAIPIAPTEAPTMQSFLTTQHNWTTVCAFDRCQYQPLLSCKPTDPSCFAFNTSSLTETNSEARNATHVLCTQSHKQCFHYLQPKDEDEPSPKLTNNVHRYKGAFDTSRNTTIARNETTDTHDQGEAHQQTLFPRVSRDQFFNCKSERGEQHDCITPSMCCSKSGCQAPPFGCPIGEVVTGPDSMLDYVPPSDEGEKMGSGHGCDEHTGLCW